MAKTSRLKIGIAIIAVSVVAVLLCRGPLFRATVTYEVERVRKTWPSAKAKHESSLVIDSQIDTALDDTADALSFTFSSTSSNPVTARKKGVAHCVGYANVFGQSFSKQSHDWVAETVVGKIRFMGIDLHQWTSNPFFINHDFVRLTDRKTGEHRLLDPVVFDYFRIRDGSEF